MQVKHRWRDAEWRVYDARRISKAIEKYLRERDGLVVSRIEGDDTHVIAVVQEMSLVCLDPIVVVMSDPVKPRRVVEAYYFDGFELSMGVQPRSVIPRPTNARWFSPTMNVGPIPLGLQDGEEHVIDVPWGRVILRADGDSWTTSAVGPLLNADRRVRR